jgi:hypothetical protein
MNIIQMVEIVHLDVKLIIHGMDIHVCMMDGIVENVVILYNSKEIEEL